MRNPLRHLSLAGLAALALAQPVQAGDKTSLEVGLSLAHPYLASRGFQPSEELNLQPSLDLIVPVKKGTFDFGYWGDFDRKHGKFETDWTLTYTRTIGKVPHLGTLTSQVAWNQYNVPDLTIEEWNGSVQLSDQALAPKLFVATDFRDGKGNAAELSLNPSFHLGSMHLNTGVALLYNDHYVTDRSGWSGVRLDVSTPILIAPGTTLTLGVRLFGATRDDLDHHAAFKATLNYHFDLGRTPK